MARTNTTTGGGGGGGITSINGDTTAAQLIVAGAGISVSTVGGTTTITNTGGGGVSGSGVANQVAYWNGTTSLTGDTGFTRNPGAFFSTLLQSINGSSGGQLVVASTGSSLFQSTATVANLLNLTPTVATLSSTYSSSNTQSNLDLDGGDHAYIQYKSTATTAEAKILADSGFNVTLSAYDGGSDFSGVVVQPATGTYFIHNGIPYYFPINQGAAGETFVNDGAGNLSWGTAGGGAPIYPTGAIPFGDSSTPGGITDPVLLNFLPGLGFGVNITDGINFRNEIQLSGTSAYGVRIDSQQITGTNALGRLELAGTYASLTYEDQVTGLVSGIKGSDTGLRLINNDGVLPSTWLWPTTDGTTGQAIVTDGAGNLSFATVGGGTIYPVNEIVFGDGSTAGGITNSIFSWNGTSLQMSTDTSRSDIFIGSYSQIAGNPTVTGTNNIGIGASSLPVVTTGSSNIGIGAGSLLVTDIGEGNTAIGDQAGAALTSGSVNTFVGFATATTLGTENNSIALGSGATITKSNQFVVGGTTTVSNWRIANVDYIMPSSDAAGSLTSDGSGNLSWAAAGSPSLTSTQIAYGDGSNLMTSSASLIFNPTTQFLSNITDGATYSSKIESGATQTRSEFNDLAGNISSVTLLLGSSAINTIGTGFNSNINLSSSAVQSTFTDSVLNVLADQTLSASFAKTMFIDVGAGITSSNTLDGVQNTSSITDSTTFQAASSLTSTGSLYNWTDLAGTASSVTLGSGVNNSRVSDTTTYNSISSLSSTGNLYSFTDISLNKVASLDLNASHATLLWEDNTSGVQGISSFSSGGYSNYFSDNLVYANEFKSLPSAVGMTSYNLGTGEAFSITASYTGENIVIGETGTGNGTAWEINDTSQTYIANKLATGGADQIVKADTNGVLGLGGIVPVGSTYTPTLTNVTNITSSTAAVCQFSQVGNTVTVFGSLAITTTLAVATEVDISLPVASNFGAVTDANGLGQATSAIATNVYIDADATNDRVRMKFIGLAIGGAGTIYFSFSYTKI